VEKPEEMGWMLPAAMKSWPVALAGVVNTASGAADGRVCEGGGSGADGRGQDTLASGGPRVVGAVGGAVMPERGPGCR